MRYFIVVFSVSSQDGADLWHSSLSFVIADGSFISRQTIQKNIEWSSPIKKTLKAPLIENIMELSEQDWNDYIKE